MTDYSILSEMSAYNKLQIRNSVFTGIDHVCQFQQLINGIEIFACQKRIKGLVLKAVIYPTVVYAQHIQETY